MKKHSKIALICWALLGIFLCVTNPSEIPIIFLVIPYALLYSAIHYTLTTLIEYYGGAKLGEKSRNYWWSHIIALCALLFLALQSIGQLATRDVVTIVFLVLLGSFYIRRTIKNNAK